MDSNAIEKTIEGRTQVVDAVAGHQGPSIQGRRRNYFCNQCMTAAIRIFLLCHC